MSYVLIVDDEPMMAESLAMMVSIYDWETEIVHGPRPAILKIQERKPALILLDMNMAGVSGLEVCSYIKRDPLNEDIPIVFVTAEDDPSFMEKAREAGAMDYLIKPVDVDELERILEYISL